MVEEFSTGYYLLRLYVEPYHGDRAVLNRTVHAELLEELYSEDPSDPETPLLMKVDEAHLAVHPDTDIPSGTLGLPDHLLEATRIDRPPTLREILLAKADQAARLLDFFNPSLPTWNPT